MTHFTQSLFFFIWKCWLINWNIQLRWVLGFASSADISAMVQGRLFNFRVFRSDMKWCLECQQNHPWYCWWFRNPKTTTWDVFLNPVNDRVNYRSLNWWLAGCLNRKNSRNFWRIVLLERGCWNMLRFIQMFMSPISLASDAHSAAWTFHGLLGSPWSWTLRPLQNRSCNDRNPENKGLSSFAINCQMILLLLASSHFSSMPEPRHGGISSGGPAEMSDAKLQFASRRVRVTPHSNSWKIMQYF